MKILISALLTIASVYSSASDYSQGGANWPSGSNDCKEQDTTAQQSPIDIITANAVCDTAKSISTLTFTDADKVSTQTLPASAGTIKLSPTDSSTFSSLTAINPNGVEQSYGAVQFHVHAPSEHKVNGQDYPLELHIVHQDPSPPSGEREYAVIGLFFEEDSNLTDSDDTLLKRWGVVPANGTDDPETSVTVNYSEIFNDIDTSDGFYSYLGGLTTPSCGEVVNWYVLKTPLKMSTAEKNYMDTQNTIGGHSNNRNTQPIGSRTVYLGNQSSCPKNEATNSTILSLSLVLLATLLVLF